MTKLRALNTLAQFDEHLAVGTKASGEVLMHTKTSTVTYYKNSIAHILLEFQQIVFSATLIIK